MNCLLPQSLVLDASKARVWVRSRKRHTVCVTLEVEQCLYRVAQEALTNVARHANAASVQVALARENGHVRLVVSDDGRGSMWRRSGDARYGLKGLRERAEHIGGKLLVESEKDKGTRVALALEVMT